MCAQRRELYSLLVINNVLVSQEGKILPVAQTLPPQATETIQKLNVLHFN